MLKQYVDAGCFTPHVYSLSACDPFAYLLIEYTEMYASARYLQLPKIEYFLPNPYIRLSVTFSIKQINFFWMCWLTNNLNEQRIASISQRFSEATFVMQHNTRDY